MKPYTVFIWPTGGDNCHWKLWRELPNDEASRVASNYGYRKVVDAESDFWAVIGLAPEDIHVRYENPRKLRNPIEKRKYIG